MVRSIPEKEKDSDIDNVPTSSATRKKATPVASEADRSRASARRERCQIIEDAWIEWNEPLQNPGDVVALIIQYSSDDGTLTAFRREFVSSIGSGLSKRRLFGTCFGYPPRRPFQDHLNNFIPLWTSTVPYCTEMCRV